jgi:outer membrane lipoprotein carrier protein
MKRIYILTALLFSFLVVLAQQDEKSKNILDQVSKKTSSFQTIQADFSFTLKTPALGINEKNDGNIILKGQKYTIDLPGIGIKIYSNGKTTWSYMKNGNQVTISNFEDGDDLMDPASLFNIYEKGFKSKFINDATVGGKAVHVIELFPDNDGMDVSKVSVNIDKATMMIQSAVLYSTDGNQYGIEVKNLATNKTFSDSNFVFDASKYPDIEIIDLR